MTTRTPGHLVPGYPVIVVDLRADGSAHVNLAGSHLDYPAGNIAETRAAIIAYGAGVAEGMKRPVRMDTTGPDGSWQLAVHPDGTVTDLNPTTTKPRRRRAAIQRTVMQRTTARTRPTNLVVPSPATVLQEALPAAGDTSGSVHSPGGPGPDSSAAPPVVLTFSTGLIYQLRGSVLLGRNPHPSHETGDYDNARHDTSGYELVAVADVSRTISKSHLSIHWDVETLTATDQGSANGTVVDRPGDGPVTLTPGVSYPLREGDVVWIGEVSFTVGEIGADQ